MHKIVVMAAPIARVPPTDITTGKNDGWLGQSLIVSDALLLLPPDVPIDAAINDVVVSVDVDPNDKVVVEIDVEKSPVDVASLLEVEKEVEDVDKPTFPVVEPDVEVRVPPVVVLL